MDTDDLINQEGLDDIPCLPSWKNGESDTNDSSEEEKENSPTPENASPPTSSFAISSSNCTTLQREEGTEPMENCSQPIVDSQRSLESDSSLDTGVSSKVKRVLNLNNSENNLHKQLPASCKNTTSISSLHRFNYQPKKRTSTDDASTNGGNESMGSLPSTQEAVDSGYLSDDEESTHADTPSENSQDMVNHLSVEKDSTPLQSCGGGNDMVGINVQVIVLFRLLIRGALEY